ncbi:D-alanyl-D-alanine carboxypeptidase [Bacillus sp. C11]|nr:D-alanyl-D-alanine carboxypeptidase [Neobacillus terrae]
MAFIMFFSTQTGAFARQDKKINIKSEAAVMIDTETGAVLYSKNPDEALYPASLTKIATAIYAIEKGNLNDIVTVSRNAATTEGTRVYLNVGEKVQLKKLIQGMLINSGNDAAVAIAEHLGGTVEQFETELNEYLRTNIGVQHTHFVTPNGLFNENHYTTAMDLALITKYALQNPVFSEVFGLKELNWVGQSWKTTLVSKHRMLNGEVPFQYVTGGKTGFIDESKQTLATSADNGKLKLVVVALKADHKKDIYKDTVKLFNYGFSSFGHETLPKDKTFKSGKNLYLVSQETMVTKPLNDQVEKVDKKSSMLNVENKNGDILQQIKLTEKKIPNEKHKEEYTENMHLNLFYGIIPVLAIFLFMFLKRKLIRS